MNNQAKLMQQQTQSILVARSLELKARRGEDPGKPPIGQLNNTHTKQIVPDPKSWDAIREALEKYATGKYTLDWITSFLNEHLLAIQHYERHPLTRSQASSILRNSFYTGKFQFRGKTYQGKHKPMISKEIFDKIQSLLKSQKR